MMTGWHEAKCILIIAFCAFFAGHFLAFGIRFLIHYI